MQPAVDLRLDLVVRPLGRVLHDQPVVQLAHALDLGSDGGAEVLLLPRVDGASERHSSVIDLHRDFVGVGRRVAQQRLLDVGADLRVGAARRLDVELVDHRPHASHHLGDLLRSLLRQQIVDGTAQSGDTRVDVHVDLVKRDSRLQEELVLDRLLDVVVLKLHRSLARSRYEEDQERNRREDARSGSIEFLQHEVHLL